MKLGQNSTLCFTILFLSAIIHGGFVFMPVHADHDEQPDKAIKLNLIHRYSPHFKGNENRPKTQQELIKELYRHDTVRHQMISHRRQQQLQSIQGLNSSSNSSISTRRNDLEKRSSSAMAMPVSSGWDYGFGQYLVKIKVGTPAQTFMLVADTGSDLTWMNCRYRCRHRCIGRIDKKRVFHADLSSTFKPVPCSSRMCKIDFSNLFSLRQCPTPFSPCRYDYRYLEGSSALGFFASESVRSSLTNGRRTRLKNVIVGCTESTEGRGGIKGGDGILGLGFGRYSFTEKAALSFGGKFSYCLVDHQSPKNVTSYLTYGRNRAVTALRRTMSYTKLVSGNPFVGSFYGVNVQGISIGGKMLNIPNQVWDLNRNGGLILDSGSSLTFLAMPAYKPVMAAMTAALSKLKRIPDQEGDAFEFCFNPAGYNEAMVPKLAFHLADGAKFEPPVKSYVINVAPQVMCLAFVPASQPGPSVIGNIMQQNHLWEFNLVRKTLGFAPSTCT